MTGRLFHDVPGRSIRARLILGATLVLVGRLRRKLVPAGDMLPIETVRGRGYRFTLR